MHTEFVSNGVRYNIALRGKSLREREQMAANIQPDPGLWTNGQKRKHGLEPSKGWKNSHGSGRLMDYLDDEAEVRKRQDSHGRERSRHYYKPKAVEFTDRAEFR